MHRTGTKHIVRHMQKSVVQWSVISKFNCTGISQENISTMVKPSFSQLIWYSFVMQKIDSHFTFSFLLLYFPVVTLENVMMIPSMSTSDNYQSMPKKTETDMQILYVIHWREFLDSFHRQVVPQNGWSHQDTMKGWNIWFSIQSIILK